MQIVLLVIVNLISKFTIYILYKLTRNSVKICISLSITTEIFGIFKWYNSIYTRQSREIIRHLY